MTPQRIAEGVDRLLERYGVSLGTGARAYLVRRFVALFRDLPVPVWDAAIERALAWFRMPEPAELWRFVPRPSWSRGNQAGYADPFHARESMALIAKISAGRCRGAEREAAFLEMAKTYPGVGWEEAAESVMRDAERE